MRITHFCIRAASLVAALMLFAVPTARAAYTVNIDQVGPDVVATGTGSLNYLPLHFVPPFVTSNSAVTPNHGGVVVGPINASDPNSGLFTGISGPTSFGTGGMTPASSGSGLAVGIDGLSGSLFVPLDYIGGDIPVSTDTWSSQSLSSLGLTRGTYTWTWGSGEGADSFTVNVLPEPASLSLLALAGAAMLRRRRSR